MRPPSFRVPFRCTSEERGTIAEFDGGDLVPADRPDDGALRCAEKSSYALG
jgi:hypothetical protein